VSGPDTFLQARFIWLCSPGAAVRSMKNVRRWDFRDRCLCSDIVFISCSGVHDQCGHCCARPQLLSNTDRGDDIRARRRAGEDSFLSSQSPV
jgi:hypothetical protein